MNRIVSVKTRVEDAYNPDTMQMNCGSKTHTQSLSRAVGEVQLCQPQTFLGAPKHLYSWLCASVVVVVAQGITGVNIERGLKASNEGQSTHHMAAPPGLLVSDSTS